MERLKAITSTMIQDPVGACPVDLALCQDRSEATPTWPLVTHAATATDIFITITRMIVVSHCGIGFRNGKGIFADMLSEGLLELL